MVREVMVRTLTHAAYDGMKGIAEHASGDEVFSAIMTMAQTSILVIKGRGGNLDGVRKVLEDLYTQVAETKTH